MVLDVGEKVLLIERRVFENDLRRHFVGVVNGVPTRRSACGATSSCTTDRRGGVVRRGDRRIRIVPLAGRYVISVLPPEVAIEELRYIAPVGTGLTLTDGRQFSMLLSEFGVPAKGSGARG